MTFAFPGRVHPKPGRFYRSKAGELWACFEAVPLVKEYGEHTQSKCFRVTDLVVQYFLDDHSFDPGGEIDQELTAELSDAEALVVLTDQLERATVTPL